MHEDGYTITVDLKPSWTCTFHRPDGTPVPTAPEPPTGIRLDLTEPSNPNAITPDWWGDPLDLATAIDGLVTAAGRRNPAAT